MSQAMTVAASGLVLFEAPERETQMLIDCADGALKRARAGGADQAEVGIASSHSRNVNVRLGEIDVLEDARERSLSVTVYRGRASGNASTGDLSPDSIAQTVERALAIARFTQPDPAGGLADADRMANDNRDFELWHPEALEMGDLIERARLIEQAGRDVDPRIDNSEGASVSMDADLGVYANSHGFVGSARQTRYAQSCVLVARDQSGMQRDWDWDERLRFDRLHPAEQTGTGAARRALRRLGARSAPTGRVPVLFDPDTAMGLVRHLVGAASGGNLYRRASFLLDRLDTTIFPEWVQISEDPHLAGGMRSCSFDDEGVATRPSSLVESGVLKRYVLGSYSARKLGLASTANAGGVRNLTFAPGSKSFTELLSEMQRGLVVTEVMGQGVNLVTGDYSRGASGFWVENGQLAFPVEEITIAGNLREMFAALIAAGSDLETRRNIRTPSLLIGEMTVAGQST